MHSLLIRGGHKLRGELTPAGDTVTTCALIAASLLSPSISHINNCIYGPYLEKYIHFLNQYPISFIVQDNMLTIDSGNLDIKEFAISTFNYPGMAELLSALVARFKRFKLYTSGNDIGCTPLSAVLQAFKQLHIKAEESCGIIICDASKYTGTQIRLDFPSSLLTRIILLISVLAEGETIIENAAADILVMQLQNMLNKMGARITHEEPGLIKVRGVQALHGTDFTIAPAKHDVFGYLCAASITGGNLALGNVFYNMSKDLELLQSYGCNIIAEKGTIAVIGPKTPQSISDIEIKPSDIYDCSIASYMLPLLSIASGESIIQNTRHSAIDQISQELKKMGASIDSKEDTITIKGVAYLRGTTLKAASPGVTKALINAALIADGQTLLQFQESVCSNLDIYVSNLKLLGASIERIE